MNPMRKMTVALLVGALVGIPAVPLVTATHDDNVWLSFRALDCPGGVPTVDETTTTGDCEHGTNNDGPAEPNMGFSRSGDDRLYYQDDVNNAALLAPWDKAADLPNTAQASPSSGGDFAPLCQADQDDNPITTGLQDIRSWATGGPNPFDGLNDIGEDGDDDANYVFTENVGNMGDIRDAVAGGDMFFDVSWFYGIPIGDNVNAEFIFLDDVPGAVNGRSDTQDAEPTLARHFIVHDATPSFGIAILGTWDDGSAGNQDGFIDETVAAEFTPAGDDNETNILGFFDPFNFISAQVDPNDGIGTIIDGINTFLGGIPLPPPFPLPPDPSVLLPPLPPLPPTDPNDPAFAADLLTWVADMTTYLTVTLPAYLLGLPATAGTYAADVATWASTDVTAWVAAVLAYADAAGPLVAYLTGPAVGNVTALLGAVVTGVTQLITPPGPVGVITTPTIDCSVEIDYFSIGGGEFETNAIFLIDDDSGRMITMVNWWNDLSDSTDDTDRVDIDQFCADGRRTGTSTGTASAGAALAC